MLAYFHAIIVVYSLFLSNIPPSNVKQLFSTISIKYLEIILVFRTNVCYKITYLEH